MSVQKKKSLDALLQEEEKESTAEELAAEQERKAAEEAERKRELEDMQQLDLPRARRDSLRQLDEQDRMVDELEDMQQLDLAAVRRKSLAAADEVPAAPSPQPPPPALAAALSGSHSWLEEVSSSVGRGLGAAWSSMGNLSNVLGSSDKDAAVSVSVRVRVSEDAHIHLDIKAVDDAAPKPSLLSTGLDAVFKSEPKETRKDDTLFNDPFAEQAKPASRSILPDTFAARFKLRPYLLGFC